MSGAALTFSVSQGAPFQDILVLKTGTLVQVQVHLAPAQAVYGHQRLNWLFSILSLHSTSTLCLSAPVC